MSAYPADLDSEFQRFQLEIEQVGKQQHSTELPNAASTILVASKPAVRETCSKVDPVQQAWQQEVLARDFELARAFQENKKVAESRADNSDKFEDNYYKSAHASYLYKTSDLQAIGGQNSKKKILKKDGRQKRVVRTAAGEIWEDTTLLEWPDNDFRLFVGDLGHDATDELLQTTFGRFSGYNMARVVKDKRTGRCKGYGFVSFSKPEGMIQAMKALNGKYVGSRPCKIRKSTWKERLLTKDKKPEVELLQQFRQRLKQT
ncbi:RNA-binding protein 42 [Galdieria sulphuraria]|nr:RNA-binding protein 42 [Galdieria sulphuraria]